MKRSAEITLTATADELRNKLFEAISVREKVSIQSCHYDKSRGLFVFKCHEGTGSGPIEVSSQVIEELFKIRATGKVERGEQKNRGIKVFLNSLFETYDQITVAELTKLSHEAGYKMPANRLKLYALSQVQGLIEVDPGVLGRPKKN